VLAEWLETGRGVMKVIFPEGLIQNVTKLARERTTRLLMVSWVTWCIDFMKPLLLANVIWFHGTFTIHA
jgi:hypothetical protein